MKKTFQILSYLQYPFIAVAMFYVLRPYYYGIEAMKANPTQLIENLNSALIFMGLSISFSTLQDTTKTQNNFSKKIWQSPKKGKIAIICIGVLVIVCLLYGMFGYFVSANQGVQQISIGMIIFGIGMIGFLKAALEVFENHRSDKNSIN